MRFPCSLLCAQLSALSLLACSSGDGATAAARRFQEKVIAGDVVPTYAMLAATDRAALAEAGYPENLPSGVRIGRGGIIETVIDSVKREGGAGDTARVAVYMTGPNMEQALGKLLLGAMSGGLDTSGMQAKAREAAKSVPRVTRVERLTMVKEDGG
jgi:hypothetical protein